MEDLYPFLPENRLDCVDTLGMLDVKVDNGDQYLCQYEGCFHYFLNTWGFGMPETWPK